MSGSSAQNVGLFVGKLGLPDIDSPFGIRRLDPICRVCRVSLGVETCYKSGKIVTRSRNARKSLKPWELNDARG
jgi:hypothetical protein